MCNCGKKRTGFKQQSPVVAKSYSNNSQQPTGKKDTVLFKYTGKTGLTITGSITRKNYRFNFPGDVQQIELSDAQGMNSVPVLQRI